MRRRATATDRLCSRAPRRFTWAFSALERVIARQRGAAGDARRRAGPHTRATRDHGRHEVRATLATRAKNARSRDARERARERARGAREARERRRSLRIVAKFAHRIVRGVARADARAARIGRAAMETRARTMETRSRADEARTRTRAMGENGGRGEETRRQVATNARLTTRTRATIRRTAIRMSWINT